VVQPGVGTIHYGAGPAARTLTRLALLEGTVLVCLALLAAWAYRSQVAAARDRLWVAMARESAHQLRHAAHESHGMDCLPAGKSGYHRSRAGRSSQADAERSSGWPSGSSASAARPGASRWAWERWRSAW